MMELCASTECSKNNLGGESVIWLSRPSFTIQSRLRRSIIISFPILQHSDSIEVNRPLRLTAPSEGGGFGVEDIDFGSAQQFANTCHTVGS